MIHPIADLSDSSLWSKSSTATQLGLRADVAGDNLYALGAGRWIYTSPQLSESPLRGCFASIALSVRRKPFEVTVGDSTALYQAAAFRPMVERVVRAENAGIICFHFDPWHPDFSRFKRVSGIVGLERDLFRSLDDELEAAYRGALTFASALSLFEHVTAIVLAQLPRTRPLDGRVKRVMLQLAENQNYNLTELAGAVGLSYYRLSHLFTGSLGINLRRYQQWGKLHKAISLLRHGESVTKVACQAGFADLSHLSRVLRQVYGVSPSHFLDRGKVCIIAAPDETASS